MNRISDSGWLRIGLLAGLTLLAAACGSTSVAPEDNLTTANEFPKNADGYAGYELLDTR